MWQSGVRQLRRERGAREGSLAHAAVVAHAAMLAHAAVLAHTAVLRVLRVPQLRSLLAHLDSSPLKGADLSLQEGEAGGRSLSSTRRRCDWPSGGYPGMGGIRDAQRRLERRCRRLQRYRWRRR